MKNAVVLIYGDEIEVWGSLTKACEAHSFSYNFLKKKKFPFQYKGIKFKKVQKDHKTISVTQNQ